MTLRVVRVDSKPCFRVAETLALRGKHSLTRFAAMQKIRRGGGRPKASPETIRHTVGVRLNAAEWAVIGRKADALGIRPTTWMRLAALSRQLPPQRVPEINREVYAELARLAGNINQLARAANAGRVVVPLQLLKAVQDKLTHLRLELLGDAGDCQDD